MKGLGTVFFLLITINLAFAADTVVPIYPAELISDQLPYLSSAGHDTITAEINKTADSFNTEQGPQIFSVIPLVSTLQLSRSCRLWVNSPQILSTFGIMRSDAIPYRRKSEIPNVFGQQARLKALVGLTIRF
jgi:hypothetical protein